MPARATRIFALTQEATRAGLTFDMPPWWDRECLFRLRADRKISFPDCGDVLFLEGTHLATFELAAGERRWNLPEREPVPPAARRRRRELLGRVQDAEWFIVGHDRGWFVPGEARPGCVVFPAPIWWNETHDDELDGWCRAFWRARRGERTFPQANPSWTDEASLFLGSEIRALDERMRAAYDDWHRRAGRRVRASHRKQMREVAQALHDGVWVVLSTTNGSRDSNERRDHHCRCEDPMTTFRDETLTGAVCRRTATHTVLVSTSAFGSPDLNTRPPPERMALPIQIQCCPSCGYRAPEVTRASPPAQSVMARHDYQEQLREQDVPSLADMFLCRSMILEVEGDDAGAGRAAMQAAWACDDTGESHAEAAARCRLRAVSRYTAARRRKQPSTNRPDTEDTLGTDLLRRSGRHREAPARTEKGLASPPDETLRDVLCFQQHLCRQQNDDRHPVDEALRWANPGTEDPRPGERRSAVVTRGGTRSRPVMRSGRTVRTAGRDRSSPQAGRAMARACSLDKTISWVLLACSWALATTSSSLSPSITAPQGHSISFFTRMTAPFRIAFP